ncbi:MAG: hypothetical protein WC508_00330 [Patescibacteria group bacterium]
MPTNPFQNLAETGKNQLEKKDSFGIGKTDSVEFKPTPEIPSPISESEQERMKQEVLKEIQETEQPLKKFGTLPPGQPITPPSAPKSPALIKIEGILEQDLQAAYLKMEPKIQQKFKAEGEKTAAKIERILMQTKIKAKDIFKLIFSWLKIIPGVNKFFIKQEAKIKTDKIIKLK